MRIVDTLQVSDELKEAMKVEIDIKGIAQCTLLPALCNRLEVLEMNMPSSLSFQTDPLLKMMILDASRDGSTVFQHLHDLGLYGCRRMETEDLVAVLKLPALHTLRSDKVNLDMSRYFGSADGYLLDGIHSNLKSIHLMYADVDPKGLEYLLKACPQLEELCLISGSDNSELQYGEMGDVLREHGTRLQSLDLSFTKLDDQETRLRRYSSFFHLTGTLGDLTSLTKLCSLSVQLRSLYGRDWEDTHIADLLPKSVRHLDLSDYDENVQRLRFHDMYDSDDSDDDVEDPPSVQEEKIVASRELRHHIDGELAALVDHPAFMHLARATVITTERSCALWAHDGLQGERMWAGDGLELIEYRFGYAQTPAEEFEGSEEGVEAGAGMILE